MNLHWRSSATFLMLSLTLFMFSLPVPIHASTPLPTVGIWSDAYGSSNISDPTIVPGSTIIVDINVTNAPAFNGYEYTLYFDPTYLQPTYLDVRSGIFTNPFIGVKDLSPGRIHLAVVNLGYPATNANGILTEISFNVTGRGVSPFTLAAATTEPSVQSNSWTQLVLLTKEIPITTSDGHFSNVASEQGPVANFTFTPTLPKEGQTITFNATGSYDPDNNSTISLRQYQWDFGDGETSINTTSPVVTYAYQSSQWPFFNFAGNFSAHLTVIDSDNGFEGMITHLVSVQPPPPPCPPGLIMANVPDVCPSIQMAVNSIVLGGTIKVSPGVYAENIVVQKPLRLIGSGTNLTTLDGSIEVDNARNVTVSGFRVLTNFGGFVGLNLFDSPNSNITDNEVVGFGGAIKYVDSTGIQLESSDNVSLTRNTVQNETFGLSIYYSSNSILRHNHLSGNTFNFMVKGAYSQDINQSNLVDGKPIFYGTANSLTQIPTNAGFLGILNSHDLLINNSAIMHEGQGILLFNSTRIEINSFEAANDSIGVNIVNSTSTIVSNSSFSGASPCTGARLEFTGQSELTNNTMLCSAYGVHLDHSSGNLILGNTLASGIFLTSSTNNTFAKNTVRGQTIISSSSNNTLLGNVFASSLELASSTGNLLVNNQFTSSGPPLYYGIEIFNSPRNVFRGNSISNLFFQVSSYHFDCPLVKIPCQFLVDYIQDIGISNSLGGRPIYYVVNRSNVKVPSYANLAGIVNSTNVTVQNASPEYSEEILVVGSKNVLIGNSNLTIPILAWEDQNLTITRNVITAEGGGLPIIGVQDSSIGVISGNRILGVSDGTQGFSPDIGLSLTNSTSYTIMGNYINGFFFLGLDLRGSSNNTINRNTIIGSQVGTIGVRLTELEFGSFPSSGNLLVGNTIAENYLGLQTDSGNTIYENNFMNNVYQVDSDRGNTWDNGAGRGNYWSDYTGQDTNNDGVGDTLLPHLGFDQYPLMTPWTASGMSASLTGRASWPETRRFTLGRTGPVAQTLYARVNDTGAAPEWIRVAFNVTSATGSQLILSEASWAGPGVQATVSTRLPVVAGSYTVVATVMYSSDGYTGWVSGNSKAFSFQALPQNTH